MTLIHGHRGFRGGYPENSIKGFIEAKNIGVDAIELDLVVSKDLELMVNHDPWLKSGKYMINKLGDVPTCEVNLFEKTHEQITQFALGTKRNFNFPEQIPFPHQIPSFKDVVSHSQLENTYWNIEIKSNERWYGKYQPQPKEYAFMVHKFILENDLINDCLVQCFDSVFLNELKKLRPQYPLGLLVENDKGFSKNLKLLDFKPDYYNPAEVLTNEKLVSEIQEQGIKCLVWTVNNIKRAQELIDWGVDGLITDYPNIITTK